MGGGDGVGIDSQDCFNTLLEIVAFKRFLFTRKGPVIRAIQYNVQQFVFREVLEFVQHIREPA